MENSSTKFLNTNRFVIEDSFTKVTSDGASHGMLTVIAGVSGLLTAIIILVVVVALISIKEETKTDAIRSHPCKKCPSSGFRTPIQRSSSCNSNTETSARSKRISGTNFSYLRQSSSILSLLRRVSSIAEDTINEEEEEDESRPRLTSVTYLSNRNLEGNLNKAFAGSEFNLSGSFSKKLQEPEYGDPPDAVRLQETVIDIHRY